MCVCELPEREKREILPQNAKTRFFVNANMLAERVFYEVYGNVIWIDVHEIEQICFFFVRFPINCVLSINNKCVIYFNRTEYTNTKCVKIQLILWFYLVRYETTKYVDNFV